MRRHGETFVVAAIAMAACAHEASPLPVNAPSQEASAPSSSPPAAVSVAGPAAPPQPETQDDEPAPRSTTPPLPQSDPMPPPAPRCPSVAALAQASAVVKREPPSRTRPPTSPDVLDIELTITLPTNPKRVAFAPNHLTVYGGVLVEQTLRPADRAKAVVLIRPSGTVAREGSLMALFGVACKEGEGNIRVDMTFALPPHDGDKVTVRRVEGY